MAVHESLNSVTDVLFDFDGTLAPNLDLPDMRRQVIALTETYQVPKAVWEDHYIVEIITAASAHLADTSTDRASEYHDAAHQLIIDIEMAAAHDTEVFDYTRSTLRALQQAGRRNVIVTRNCSQAVELTFPDWQEYADLLLARDQVEYLKPDPRHLQQGLRPSNNGAIISDGAMDMETGRRVGLACVGVLTGSSDSERLLAAGAHTVLSDISQLIDLT